MKAIKLFVVALLLGSNVAAVTAAPVNGTGTAVRRCNARSSVVFFETCRAGEVTTVSIVGDGDTDLDLYVYDANNNLIASGIGLSDRETVSFVPHVTSTFRIEVRNLGNVWNQFSIVAR